MKSRKSEHQEKIEQYAEWLTTPEEERLIKTQKEFAKSIGVEEHTLVRWKVQLAKTDTGDEIARFRRHLNKLAMKPHATAKHMELYARLKGLLEKPEPLRDRGMTADELARFHIDGERAARQMLREEGYAIHYDQEEIQEILKVAHQNGMLYRFVKAIEEEGGSIESSDKPLFNSPM